MNVQNIADLNLTIFTYLLSDHRSEPIINDRLVLWSRIRDRVADWLWSRLLC